MSQATRKACLREICCRVETRGISRLQFQLDRVGTRVLRDPWLSKRRSGASASASTSAVAGAGMGSECPLEESGVCWQVRCDDMYVVSAVSTIQNRHVSGAVEKLRKQKVSATFRATTILKQQVPDNLGKSDSHGSVVVYHLPLALLALASSVLSMSSYQMSLIPIWYQQTTKRTENRGNSKPAITNAAERQRQRKREKQGEQARILYKLFIIRKKREREKDSRKGNLSVIGTGFWDGKNQNLHL